MTEWEENSLLCNLKQFAPYRNVAMALFGQKKKKIFASERKNAYPHTDNLSLLENVIPRKGKAEHKIQINISDIFGLRKLRNGNRFGLIQSHFSLNQFRLDQVKFALKICQWNKSHSYH